MPRDQYHDIAASALPTLTVDQLANLYRSTAKLMESRDDERRQHVLVVSALLELLGGQAILPAHALANAPGYQTAKTTDGALVLQIVEAEGH